MKSVLLVLTSLLTVFPAWGHGGGLDAYGCHHNRKAGGYHCHRGPMTGRQFTSKEEMLQAMREQTKAVPSPSKPRQTPR